MSLNTHAIKPMAMRDALIERIGIAMQSDPTIFFVSADFGSPKLDSIRQDFPTRFLNVGIAEQNLINVSAGLALEGFKVFAYAIAPFITMRCYEQTRVSLALLSNIRQMNVNLIGVGAGCSYVVSGPTHQCYEDITLMRAMPNFTVMSPADHITSASLLDTCVQNSGPKYLRLDAQVLTPLYDPTKLDLAQGFAIHPTGSSSTVAGTGTDALIIATGYMVHTALQVQHDLARLGVAANVVDIFNLSTFDERRLVSLMQSSKTIFSIEEGFTQRGGLDALLFNVINRHHVQAPYVNGGIDQGYRFELGERAQLHDDLGLSASQLTHRIQQALDVANASPA